MGSTYSWNATHLYAKLITSMDTISRVKAYKYSLVHTNQNNRQYRAKSISRRENKNQNKIFVSIGKISLYYFNLESAITYRYIVRLALELPFFLYRLCLLFLFYFIRCLLSWFVNNDILCIHFHHWNWTLLRWCTILFRRNKKLIWLLVFIQLMYTSCMIFRLCLTLFFSLSFLCISLHCAYRQCIIPYAEGIFMANKREIEKKSKRGRRRRGGPKIIPKTIKIEKSHQQLCTFLSAERTQNTRSLINISQRKRDYRQWWLCTAFQIRYSLSHSISSFSVRCVFYSSLVVCAHQRSFNSALQILLVFAQGPCMLHLIWKS